MARVPTCKSVVFSIMVLLILLSTSSVAQSRQADAVKSLYQKAREAESRKNYQEAIGYYKQILKLDPTLHTLRANLGLMHYLNEEYDQAAWEFRQALAGDANLYMAYLFLGLSLLEMNQVAEALSHLERAVHDKPQDNTARFHLARAYYHAERYQSALEQLQYLRKKQPDEPETLYLLGRVHMKLSLEAYEQLKQKDPESYRIYQLLAESYEAQALNGPAIANYRKALDRNPKARGIYLRLGNLFQASGELEKALEAYRQELSINPGDAYAMYKAGEVLLDQSRLDEASKYLEESVSKSPNLAPARVSYGRCLLEQNHVQEAIRELRLAVKLDAEAAMVWFQLARAYHRAGDRVAEKEALLMYEKLKDKN